MKTLGTLLLAFFLSLSTTVYAEVDIGIDGVFVLSDDLGYNTTGYGIQLDASGKHGNWGWDFQGTALRHGKWLANGERYQVIAMGRRFFGDFFLEAGGEWGGYQSRFEDGVVWEKYGYAPAVGVGVNSDGTEVTLRYLLPDTTPNNTSIATAGLEIPLNDSYVGGVSIEYWSFDIGDERLNGVQVNLEFGYRF